MPRISIKTVSWRHCLQWSFTYWKMTKTNLTMGGSIVTHGGAGGLRDAGVWISKALYVSLAVQSTQWSHVVLSPLKQTDRYMWGMHQSGGDVRWPTCVMWGPPDRTEQKWFAYEKTVHAVEGDVWLTGAVSKIGNRPGSEFWTLPESLVDSVKTNS